MNLLETINQQIKDNGGRLRTLRLIELEWSKPYYPKATTKYWSTEDEAMLVEMYNNGDKVKDISVKLNRPRDGVEAKIGRLIKRKVGIIRRSIPYL